MSTESIASAYAQAVLRRPHIPHAAVRFGLWIAACAEQQGGFPVTTTIDAILKGLETDHIHAPGVKFRYETINQSIDVLEREGLLEVERASRNSPRNFTLTLN